MAGFLKPQDYIRNVTSLRELVIGYYGQLIENHPVDSDYTLTTTPQQVGSVRNQSIAKALSNTGTNNCAISFSPNVTITTGILLQPGGFMYLNWFFDYDFLFKPLWAIAATGGTTLHMIESQLSGV